jgi:membrane protease YdiL (CAAX protease family)
MRTHTQYPDLREIKVKKIILFAAVSEILYLVFSFSISQAYGHWSISGELIRTSLRIVSIFFFAYLYQRYFFENEKPFKAKGTLTLPFAAAIQLFFLFAIVYTNAKGESALWQLVFFISGLAAGLREELFYRGMIQKTLQEKYGCRNALIFGTLIFTLSHLQYLYQGQFRELMLIAFAGIIFGSIFIHTGSVLFAGTVHGLYDAILSVNLVPFRLSYNASMPILFLIMSLFLIIISNKLYVFKRASASYNEDQDGFSLP